jgi:hypothetical protein
MVPLAATATITSNARTVRLAEAFWPAAERTIYRWDIVNERLGDTGTEAVVQNADGSKTMYMLRLKVQAGRITEIGVPDRSPGTSSSAVIRFGHEETT